MRFQQGTLPDIYIRDMYYIHMSGIAGMKFPFMSRLLTRRDASSHSQVYNDKLTIHCFVQHPDSSVVLNLGFFHIMTRFEDNERHALVRVTSWTGGPRILLTLSVSRVSGTTILSTLHPRVVQLMLAQATICFLKKDTES